MKYALASKSTWCVHSDETLEISATESFSNALIMYGERDREREREISIRFILKNFKSACKSIM